MKEKLKFIPVNLLLGIPQAVIVYMMLRTVIKIDLTEAVVISAMYFIYDLGIQCRLDYLEDKLK